MRGRFITVVITVTAREEQRRWVASLEVVYGVIAGERRGVVM